MLDVTEIKSLVTSSDMLILLVSACNQMPYKNELLYRYRISPDLRQLLATGDVQLMFKTKNDK